MSRFQWLSRHPIALVNVGFILIISVLFSYQLLRPIDVLQDWNVRLSPVKEYKVIDGERLPVYHPGDSLIFESSSKKVANAKGSSSRTIICEPTATQDEREIQLDVIPANKPTGVSAPRENAIVVPDVSEFNGLPRICRLFIDISYERVSLWRNHNEQAQSERFLVEEVRLTPKQIQEKIDELTERVRELEAQLSENGATLPVAAQSQPIQYSRENSPQNTATTPTQESPTKPQAGIIQGLFNASERAVDTIVESLLRR